MALNYAWEKFHSAVRGLVGPAPIQERLCGAWVFNLIHVDIADLPERIRDEFQALRAKLRSGEPKGDEGTVAAFCNTLTDDEALQYAYEIVSMYDAVTRQYGASLEPYQR